MIPPVTYKIGDYIYTCHDTPENREAAISVMKRNGCRDWRFEKRGEDTVACHGFVADGQAKYLETV